MLIIKIWIIDNQKNKKKGISLNKLKAKDNILFNNALVNLI